MIGALLIFNCDAVKVHIVHVVILHINNPEFVVAVYIIHYVVIPKSNLLGLFVPKLEATYCSSLSYIW